MKQGRKTFILLLIVVLAICGLLLQYRKRQPPRYKTAPVERGDLISSVSATGSLNALISVQVGTQVSGMIKELYVDFNSPVKKGQVIARIDPEMFQAQLSQAQAIAEGSKGALVNAQAEVKNARANVENARANLEKAEVEIADAKRSNARAQELAAKGLISETEREAAMVRQDSSQAQLAQARAQLNAAEAQRRAAQAKEVSALAQLKQAEASLRMAQVNLKHTIITSPIEGVVISRNVDVGQTVAASLQAPTLFTIAQDLTKMQAIANVDEADVGRVRVGQEATFSVDAFPDQVFVGRIAQIRNAPIMVQNVVTYETIVEVDNPERLLKPGMTANISIKIEERKDVLKLPNAALRFRPPDSEAPSSGGSDSVTATGIREKGTQKDRVGQTRVWTLAPNGRLEPVWVKLGIGNGVYTEVREGPLREGQQVVVEAGSRASGAPGTPSPGSRGMMRGIF